MVRVYFFEKKTDLHGMLFESKPHWVSSCMGYLYNRKVEFRYLLCSVTVGEHDCQQLRSSEEVRACFLVLTFRWVAVTDPVQMANESFDFVKSTVYNFDNTTTIPHLGEEYYDRNLPVVQARLMAAGVRLGHTLESILTDSKAVKIV